MNITDQDIALWQAFRQGDKDSFGLMFRKYYTILYQFGSRVTVDNDILEDCIQELFIELWQSSSPAPVYSVKAYLIRALKYKLTRSVKLSRISTSLHNADDYQFELSHEHFIITNQENLEKTAKVKSALNYLSNRQKEIIYLKYYQGLSYEEICTVMDLNYQVARNLLSQAIKSLKKMFLGECMIVIAAMATAWHAS